MVDVDNVANNNHNHDRSPVENLKSVYSNTKHINHNHRGHATNNDDDSRHKHRSESNIYLYMYTPIHNIV